MSERSGITSQQVTSQQVQQGLFSSPGKFYNGWKFDCEGRVSIREIIEEDKRKKKSPAEITIKGRK